MPRRHVAALVAGVCLAIALAGTAWAYFGVGASTGSSGAAQAATVAGGHKPSATVDGADVTVSWSASTLSNGHAVDGYVVKRYDGSNVLQSIGGACSGTITATTCVESGVPNGTWKYTVTPKIGTNWRGAESAKSDPAIVNVVTGSLSLDDTVFGAPLPKSTTGSISGFHANENVAYRLDGTGAGTGTALTGSPTVVDASGDATITSLTIPAGTSDGSHTVHADGDAGSHGHVDIVVDTTPPTVPDPTVTAGYYTTLSVPVTLGTVTDGGTGVNPGSIVVKRAEVALSNGNCDSFVGVPYSTTVTLSGGSDTTVAQGKCYRWQELASDNAGNQGMSEPSNTAKIDTTAPSTPSLSFGSFDHAFFNGSGTLYFGPFTGSFKVTASSTDAQSAVASYSFSDLSANGFSNSQSGADNTYSFTASATAPVANPIVNATNNAGLTSSNASFSMVKDSTAPTAPTPAVTAAYFTTASVGVDIGTATDGGSGIATIVVQRDEATLSGGTCGSFPGTFATTVALSSGNDTSVSSGKCYQWRQVVTDNVGNAATSSASNIAKVDTSGPSVSVGTITGAVNPSAQSGCQQIDNVNKAVFYSTANNANQCNKIDGTGGTPKNATLTVPVTASDSQSGMLKVNFPTLAGALGGGGDVAGAGPSFQTTYTWNAASTTGSASGITGFNNAGLTTGAAFTITLDNTAPTAASAPVVTAGGYSSLSIPVTRGTGGSDAGSGLAAVTLQRSEAGLTSGVCGTFGAFADVTLTGGNDTSVQNDRCYKYQELATDNVGNTAASASSAIVFTDNSAPTITVNNLTASANPCQFLTGTSFYYSSTSANGNSCALASGSFTVPATAADAQSGVLKVNFQAVPGMTGGGDDPSSPYSSSYSWDAATTSFSGSRDVTATNNTLLTATGTFSVALDNIAPTGGAITANGSASTSYNSSGSVTIATTGFVDTGGSGIGSNVITRASGTLSGDSCGSLSGATVVTSPNAVTNGCYQYTLTGTDNVGNKSSVVSAVVKVDTSGPTQSLALSGTTGPANRQYINNSPGYATNPYVFINAATGNSNSFTVADTAADPDTGVTSINFPANPATPKLTGGGLDSSSPFSTSYSWDSTGTSGAVTLTGTSFSGAQSTSPFNVVKDITAPAGGALTVNSVVATAGGSTSSNKTGSFSIGALTQYTEAESTTAAGLNSSTLTRQDGTLSNNSCSSYGSAAPINGSAPISQSGLADGCYLYTLTGTDNVGNAVSISTTVKVDTVAPSTSITINPASPNGDNSYYKTTAPTFTLSATDGGSGVASSSYQIDSGTVTAYSSAVTIPNGSHTITYFSTDTAGNAETGHTTDTINVDTVAPSTSIAFNPASPNGTNSWYKTTAPTFTFGATDATSGVASTSYKIDSGSFQTYTGAVTVPEGTHTISYFSTDNAGNVESTGSATVKVDTINPTGGSITANGSGSDSYNATGTISLSKTDFGDSGSGIATNAITRASAPLTSNSCGSFTGAAAVTIVGGSDNTTNLPTSCYRYTLTGTDSAGNQATTLSAIVKVDRSIPTGGAITANGSGSTSFNKTGTVSLSKTDFTDGDSGIASNAITRASATLTNNVCGSFSGSTVVTIVGGNDSSTLTDGCYQYTLTGTNNAGGQATVLSATVKVDTTKPAQSFALSSPSGGGSFLTGSGDSWTLYFQGSVSGQFNLSDTATETGSGLVANGISFPGFTGVTNWTNLTAKTCNSPCTSNLYKWTGSGSTGTPADQTVTATDAATNADSALIHFVNDTTAPSGPAMSSLTSSFVTGNINLSVDSASDDVGGSGVGSVQYFYCTGSSCTPNTAITPTSSTGPNYTVNWSIPSSVDGTVTIGAKATDNVGNTSGFGTTQTLNVNNPTASTLTLAGGSNNRPDNGDSAAIVFSSPLDESTICSTWPVGGPTTTINVTLTFNNNAGTAGNGGNGFDTITLGSADCTLNFGTLNLGANNFVSAAGVSETGTLSYNVSTRTLTLSITSTPASGLTAQSNKTVTYTPSGIKGRSGATATGSPTKTGTW